MVDERSPASSRNLPALAAFLALCLGVSAIGGAITATSVNSWYPTLAKPFFTPPGWVFPPVWTILYVLMAIAAWRIWRRRPAASVAPALRVFALQLGLNLAWSFLFFGLQRVGAALAEMIVLLAAILWTARLFAGIDRPAALLLVPYALWVGFATVLTAAIWMAN